MAAKQTKTKEDFIRLLRSDTLPPEKQESSLHTRIIALGHGTYCGRCGGSGNYSFNHTSGTRCFGCDGSRYVKTKLTDQLYAGLEADVAAGKLDTYLVELRQRQEINRKCKNATDRVMNAWTSSGVTKSYVWQRAANKEEPHLTIAQEYNRPMADAYQSVSKASEALTSAQWKRKKALTSEDRDAVEILVTEASNNLAQVTDAALATIQERTAALKEFLAGLPQKAPGDETPSPGL
ncbi:hypothetical protein HNP46_000436 [Pseudomonas nitritireducens]|uniref:Uncharacterized protein n=1 Tax=Pseudomonas nitroreducens TaxID=46680 RepID=A0A7W7KEZ1_PSENT|nr:hypothetical protein [Pseudomonas nitritireducens]MBB4861625.1 hypothetical protein [Pseudomonas nitritireducens]